MSRDRIRRLAAESQLAGSPALDGELEAIRAAILVEDVLGVTLADEEIVPGLLADPAALEHLVLPRERGVR